MWMRGDYGEFGGWWWQYIGQGLGGYQWQRQVPIVVRRLGESLLDIKKEENTMNALVVLE